jgi:hypothetical protein
MENANIFPNQKDVTMLQIKTLKASLKYISKHIVIYRLTHFARQTKYILEKLLYGGNGCKFRVTI